MTSFRCPGRESGLLAENSLTVPAGSWAGATDANTGDAAAGGSGAAIGNDFAMGGTCAAACGAIDCGTGVAAGGGCIATCGGAPAALGGADSGVGIAGIDAAAIDGTMRTRPRPYSAPMNSAAAA